MSPRGRVERLLRSSPGALLGRAFQLLSARWERLTRDRAARRAAGPRLSADCGASPAELRDAFAGRVAGSSFPAFRDIARTREALLDLDPEILERSVERARAAEAGRFDLLGYEALDFGSPVDWHLDPVSGRRAPRSHWSRVPYLDPSSVGDHKVIWELNRHRHLVDYARAYVLTGDEAWAEAFLASLFAWMEANPLKRGINWASSLEVGLRSIAWVWALHAFVRSDRLGAAEFSRVVGWLRAGGMHLERHISRWFSPNTHLTGEALALVYLAVSLPELPEAARWRTRGLGWLVEGLDTQIRPDGVYFEQSTYYHRYTADFAIHLHLLSELHDLGVSDRTARWIEGLTGFLAAITRPDGTIPLVGDDDGGRLVFLDDRAPADARSPILAAATLFERPDWAFVGGPPSEELIWLLGPDAPQRLARIDPEPPGRTAAAFVASGFHVSRASWEADADMLLIRGGPHGPLSAGHAHADALAIDLTLAGRPTFIDPGTGSYMDPALRDGLRATPAHNTLSVGTASSSVPAGPFSWATHADSRTRTWCTTEVADLFAGSHDGFRRLGFRHERTLIHLRLAGYWICRDRVVASTPVAADALTELTVHFTLAPGLTAETRGPGALRVLGPEGAVADLATGLADARVVGMGPVSPVYGRVLEGTRLALRAPAPPPDESVDIVTIIGPPGSVDLSPGAGAGGRVWRVGPGHDLLAMRAPGATLSASTPRVETDFEWVWARPAAAGGWSAVVAFGGRTIRGLGAHDLELREPVRSLAVRLSPGASGGGGGGIRLEGANLGDGEARARAWVEGLQAGPGSAVAEVKPFPGPEREP